jgi:MoaA/NifB/PqqE/SkfB family radical SAM enzyme
MTLETFRKALELCEDTGSIPFIGGGEPTLHPLFEQFMFEAMACESVEAGITLGIVTNGSITNRAMQLAHLTEKGMIRAELSQDQYHDPIDMEVVHAFEKLREKNGGFGGVRDTSNGGQRQCLPHGRGVELLGLPYHDPDFVGEDTRDEGDCPCPDWTVYPSGIIRQCGCEDAQAIGNVWDGIQSPMSECCRSKEFLYLCIEDEQYKHLVYN